MCCAFRRVVGLKVMVVYNQRLFLINAGIMGCSLQPCKGIITDITLVMQCIREPSAQCLITREAEQREECECLYSDGLHLPYAQPLGSLYSFLIFPLKMFIELPEVRVLHCRRGRDRGWMKFFWGSLLAASLLS